MRTALALLVAAVPSTAAGQWTIGAEVARTYEDNLPNAQLQSDVTRDHALALRGSLGRFALLADGDLLLRGEARAARYDNYTGLDRFALGLGAGWRRKIGVGLTAPWVAADAALFAQDYGTAVRDGPLAILSLEIGKRFDPRFDASLGVAYDRREQNDDLPVVPGISGRPFSLQGRSIALRGNLALDASWVVFGAVSARRGDVVSSTRRNFQIFQQSAAIAADPAFGPDYFAYSLTGASSTSGTIGVSWALGTSASLNASLTGDRTRARGGLDYDGNVYSLSFVYRD